MQNQANLSDITRFSFLALARMAELEIAPSPQNYYLWFEIESGANPALKREAEMLISQGIETLDDARFTQLFDRHIGAIDKQDRLDAAENKLSGILSMFENLLNDASVGAEGSRLALNALAGQTTGEDVLTDLRSLISGLTNESRTMVDNNRVLAQRLAETSNQVDALKSDLRSAREDALNDQLTGLCNRKAMDMALRAAMAGAPDHGAPNLLLIDVDHFKSFNDQFGHTVGDEVLKVVGRCLKENVKGKDTAARYGGEEFAVILPATSVDEAVCLAEQLRKAIAGKKFRRRATGESLPVVTVSIGLSSYQIGESGREWIERADACLYEAKSAGRNCLKVAGPVEAKVETAA